MNRREKKTTKTSKQFEMTKNDRKCTENKESMNCQTSEEEKGE